MMHRDRRKVKVAEKWPRRHGLLPVLQDTVYRKSDISTFLLYIIARTCSHVKVHVLFTTCFIFVCEITEPKRCLYTIIVILNS